MAATGASPPGAAFVQECIATGTAARERPIASAGRQEVPLGTPPSVGSDAAVPGESRVKRYLRRHSLLNEGAGGPVVTIAALNGNPWDDCEDILQEDLVEWCMDSFRRRDAARPERPEELVTKALAESKPPRWLQTRLEAIVREPIHLLDPLLLDAGKVKTGSSAASDVSTPRSLQRSRSFHLPSAMEDLAAGPGTALSLASVESSGSASESRRSLWPGSSSQCSLGLSEIETATSSPARRPGRGGPEHWELEFVVRSAVDEVWRRLREGRQTQDIFQLLTDTRKHLIICQVKRLRSLVSASS